ncbi:MAG: undecaprenyldiphospho-muramoylpentapeptide beta-N-acetylglucosaminyltransferase [Pseudoflavonifractor sp.]
MRVLFTCGGTAGHINPAVALARLFTEHNPGCEILFVGADGGMETRLVPKEGYALKTVTITSFRRSLTPAALGHNFKTLLNMGKSRGQANAILDDFRPDLVVGTGGYASYPVVRAAARRKIPTAVHESNAVPGLTTKALAKVVDKVMVGFEESRAYYDCPEKVVVTGTPVRGDFFRYTRQQAREVLGIADDRPLVLSYWGSLGAEAMNSRMTEFIALECGAGEPFHHLHGAGRDFAAMERGLEAKKLALSEHPSVELREYIYNMPTVMAAADLVLCRAGASTVSELSALAKPSVLVPSPNVTGDHQTKNAKVLAAAGGALLLPEGDCTPEGLYKTVNDLLADGARRENMTRALQKMAIPDAAEQIYGVLSDLIAIHS